MTSSGSIDEYIGNRLRKCRKKIALSQAVLAKKINVSHQLIQKYESGETRISAGVLYEIAKVIGVNPNYFFEGYLDNSANATKSRFPEEGDTIQFPHSRPLSILLVEDNPQDEIITRKAIEAYDATIQVHTVYDGVAALTTLRNYDSAFYDSQSLPDIIFLDLNLPKRSGIDVLKELKRDRNLNFIPVVVLTNSINAKEMFECYKNYASGYLHKSFELSQFRQDMKLVLEYWGKIMVTPSNF